MEIKEKLTLEDIDKLILKEEELSLSSDLKIQISESYEFLKEFSKEKVIYGINTGFGPMAQWKIEEKDLEKLQYNIIRRFMQNARNGDFFARNAKMSKGNHTKRTKVLKNRKDFCERSEFFSYKTEDFSIVFAL